jgi:cephalosporin hydroxylase
MSAKKLYSRQEFGVLLKDSALAMARDKRLCRDARRLLIRADHFRWIHQTSWMGEPILNLPQDMFAIQDIIFRTRPDYVIEVGVAWGGSLLFYSTLMEVLGGKRVIGIDTYIPPDLRKRLASHRRLAKRFELIDGSSLDAETLRRVRAPLGRSRRVLVILDSNHTHEHVLSELRLYSPFVGKGHYLIVGDTIIEDIPPQRHRRRAWGPGNNPKTALWQFLKENNRFQVDSSIEAKLLLTCSPQGYLKRVR